MIAIVDYGIGNLGSVTKGFRHAGAEVELCGEPAALRRADALVLPGDGAFGATMAELEARGLVPLLREAVDAGHAAAGHLHRHAAAVRGERGARTTRGLGLLPGRVRRFDASLTVPHMGWNTLRARRAHPLLDGVADGAHVYFVHSYYCDAPDDVVIATSDYGHEFAAIVGRGNVLGLQFHPEKSQAIGLRLVANFVASRRARGARAPGR